ncbi:uncharacterized protein LOC124190251 isoform X1 [Daphnia pulex]|uniref:uncharacterized protein LOC124190251 isoform X1 n=2 Tax=Daphnia pulex TaxID=6669 RepID=UPI001EE11E9D|nr:uncharacterized protein LOC124190251 isoform X1 [Daphnia pulex]
METNLFISCLVFLAAMRYTISSAVTHTDNVFSLHRSKTCLPEHLLPVFMMTWNDYRIKVHQVTSEVTAETKYFLQSNLRSNGVVCVTQNISAFNFSFTGNLLNQPVEFYFYQMLGNTEILFQNMKTVEKYSFQCNRIMINNQAGNIPINKWKFSYEYQIREKKTAVINGTLSTNCNPFEENSESTCIFETVLNLQGLQISLLADGKIERSLDGGMVSAHLKRKASNYQLDQLLFNANWSTSEEAFLLSAEIVFGAQSLLSLKINSSTLNNRELSFELVSLAFDWRWFSNSVIQPTQDGRKVVAFSEGNYLFHPSAKPINYLFGLVESNSSSRVFDLRHNVSSALYRFEGNMTVDLKPSDSEPQIVTEITQKVRTSSLERAIHLDLRQIFHQFGHWNWETVVLKSGLFDMHVSGHWNHTILQLYRKRFQIHSHDEDYLPSLNVEINYSDSLRFHHIFSFPFLACSYGFLIEFTDPSSFVPARVQILFRDEFQTNYSQSILQLNLYKPNGCLNADGSADWFEISRITDGVRRQLEKLTNWIADDQHPINQLLQPILQRSTLAHAFGDVYTLSKVFLLLL